MLRDADGSRVPIHAWNWRDLPTFVTVIARYADAQDLDAKSRAAIDTWCRRYGIP